MKRQIISLLAILLILSSCGGKQDGPVKKIESAEELIEIKNGVYKEYYPGKKEVRITGRVNDKNLREGKWVFMAKNGVEMSICMYRNGKKEGHSIVKHPNGAINYVGEYHNDKMIGVWEFYDVNGKFLRKVDYGPQKD